MKVEGSLFIGCAVFFGAADLVYWYVSKDPTGTTALALAVGLLVVAPYLAHRLRRRSAEERPFPPARTAGGRCSWASRPPSRRSVPRSDGGFS